MFDLKKILGEGLEKKGLGKSIQAALACDDVEKALREILPETIMDKTKVVSLKNFVITVRTSSSVIAQEIRLHEGDIINRLREKFGQETIKGIRYLR